MRITQTHARFWAARHRPAWAAGLPLEGHGSAPLASRALASVRAFAAVHACVNDHAGPYRPDTETHNLLALCHGARRRGGSSAVRDLLESAAASAHSTARRRVLARRWLQRLELATFGGTFTARDARRIERDLRAGFWPRLVLQGPRPDLDATFTVAEVRRVAPKVDLWEARPLESHTWYQVLAYVELEHVSAR